MDDLTTFQSTDFGNLRVFLIDGNPWFVANDVCRALGLERYALRRLDPDEKGVRSTHTLGGNQAISIVSESGLYSLVLGSRKPEARSFKRWVTHDVLPSIRQHGSYTAPSVRRSDVASLLSDPQSLILFLQQLSSERDARISAESALQSSQSELSSALSAIDSLNQQLNTLSPTVFVRASDPDANNLQSIPQLAASFSSHDHPFSARRLYSLLRKDGYIFPHSTMPTTSGLRSGYFVVLEKQSGHSRYYTTAVTVYGQLMLECLYN